MENLRAKDISFLLVSLTIRLKLEFLIVRFARMIDAFYIRSLDIVRILQMHNYRLMKRQSREVIKLGMGEKRKYKKNISACHVDKFDIFFRELHFYLVTCKKVLGASYFICSVRLTYINLDYFYRDDSISGDSRCT